MLPAPYHEPIGSRQRWLSIQCNGCLGVSHGRSPSSPGEHNQGMQGVF
ncbi:hypothetical protein SAMN02746041_01622 [Desulfacinum hydrothermale DSM 13146]|uniref:Uncharacterized protein n=1 Tax=Desulfacinum hydrothermale DSM 13146 TaxID=1121390 RepID=A0A1W1XHN9_9BACT|nr:hypothetical protein SAMN02746041_01622 [Desulfacinum hydrothermale DSM 13146]